MTRYTGKVVLMGADPDTSVSLVNKISFSGGEAAWATMAESVQGVSHDVAAGTTSVSFGPTEALGPNDLIERHRANRRNSYHLSSTPKDGEEMQDAVGGYVAGPFSNMSRVGGGGEAEASHPWLVWSMELLLNRISKRVRSMIVYRVSLRSPQQSRRIKW